MSKSLEIVNKEIESIHNQLNDYDEDDEEYGFYPSYETLIYELNELEAIKQDLEVLEIIRKKKVDVYYLHALLKNGEVDVVLNRYNIYAREGALTTEELLKLKKWLEVN